VLAIGYVLLVPSGMLDATRAIVIILCAVPFVAIFAPHEVPPSNNTVLTSSLQHMERKAAFDTFFRFPDFKLAPYISDKCHGEVRSQAQVETSPSLGPWDNPYIGDK
jgi:hypothetical protein